MKKQEQDLELQKKLLQYSVDLNKILVTGDTAFPENTIFINSFKDTPDSGLLIVRTGSDSSGVVIKIQVLITGSGETAIREYNNKTGEFSDWVVGSGGGGGLTNITSDNLSVTGSGSTRKINGKIAANGQLGLMMPDGSTITVDSSGKASVNLGTALVKSLKLGSDVIQGDIIITGAVSYDKGTNTLTFSGGTGGQYSSSSLVVDNVKNTIDIKFDTNFSQNPVSKEWSYNGSGPSASLPTVAATSIRGANVMDTVMSFTDTAAATMKVSTILIYDQASFGLDFDVNLLVGSSYDVSLVADFASFSDTITSPAGITYTLYSLTSGKLELLGTISNKQLSIPPKSIAADTEMFKTTISPKTVSSHVYVMCEGFTGAGTSSSKKIGLVGNLKLKVVKK